MAKLKNESDEIINAISKEMTAIDKVLTTIEDL
jgi:hypothetical protein